MVKENCVGRWCSCGDDLEVATIGQYEIVLIHSVIKAGFLSYEKKKLLNDFSDQSIKVLMAAYCE